MNLSKQARRLFRPRYTQAWLLPEEVRWIAEQKPETELEIMALREICFDRRKKKDKRTRPYAEGGFK